MPDISRLHYCSDCIARHELSGRCPCPFDPRHSVLLTKLSGHLRLCQSKPGVSAAAGENGAVVPRSGGADAQVPGINAAGEGSDEAWQGSVLLSPEADADAVTAATSDLALLTALAERMAAVMAAALLELEPQLQPSWIRGRSWSRSRGRSRSHSASGAPWEWSLPRGPRYRPGSRSSPPAV